MKRSSELTLSDIISSSFGGAVKIVYNGNTIYEDSDKLYIDGKTYIDDPKKAWDKLMSKYGHKAVYNFYCRVVYFHHTELYIEGEKL